MKDIWSKKSEEEYAKFKHVAIDTHSPTKAAKAIGIEYYQAAYRGYINRLLFECPNYKRKNNISTDDKEDNQDNHYNGNSELVLSVIGASTRQRKFKLISEFRIKLIQQYGETLMDVPEDEPKLAELRDANRFIGGD